ncbi:MAG: discoidin domain-containing protein [Vicinamibacteria bacterium]
MGKKSIHFLTLTLALWATTAVALAKEMAPGAIANPDGLQRFQGAAYNSELDEYLIIYQGNSPRVRRLGTNGTLLAPEVQVDKPMDVANVGVVYNPIDNQYLAVYRSDDNIFGRYLDSHGVPLGSRFSIGTGGEVGVAAYSSKSRRFLVVWRKGPQPIHVNYALINGDSTAPKPVISSGALANGDNPQAAWGSASNRFLVVYTREVGDAKEEVFGRLVNPNGGIGSEFKIVGGPKSQTDPQVSYASSKDVFLVSVSDWRNVECCRADVVGQRLDSAGNKLGPLFDIVATGNGGWDVACPIGFNEATGQFIATTYIEPSGLSREIDPSNGSRGPIVELNNKLSAPIAIATRPHPSDPQALILTRSNLGGDGVHAHIVHLTAGPPTFTSAELPDGLVDVPYSQPTPVTGGATPLTFELRSDPSTLAPGITGPNRNTGLFTGKPTQPGTFGPFRVRVTDQRGRSVEANLTHTIGLGAPTLTSPLSVAVGFRQPTFQWTAVPGATSYHLVVENLSNGNIVINPSNIPGTSFTPGFNLPTGRLFQWRVQASGGGVSGPFSNNGVFEIDTTAPPAIVLTATIPVVLSEIQELVAISASSEHSGLKKMENLVDGSPDTSWMTEGTATNVPEQVTVDLGAVLEVRQVSLRSKRAARFPKDFQIQISNESSTGFVTLATRSAFAASADTWYSFDVIPTRGRYVRILVTQKGFHRGAFWTEISEANVSAMAQARGTIEYRWHAPADDQGDGTEPVMMYDLRLMKSDGANFNYASGTPIPWTPIPVLPGEQSVRVSGLRDEVQFAAAMTSIDDAGNRSALSNIVVLSTPGIAPGPVTGLEVVNDAATGSSIRLRWVAPPDNAGDNSSGLVARYDLRCSTSPILDLATFNGLPKIQPGPIPAQPGTVQIFDVPGLANDTVYYCGILAFDDAGLMSHSGQAVLGRTADVLEPGPVSGLQVVNAAATSTSIRLRWVAPPDDAGDNSSGPVARYDLRCSTSPILDLATFNGLPKIQPGPIPAPPGTVQIFDVSGLAHDTLYYCGILAFDDAGLMSHSGQAVQGRTAGALPPS